MAGQITLTIDGRETHVPAGTTLLDAARAVGIAIPTLCSTQALPCGGTCFICAVRVEGRPGLWPACTAPVAEGMVVATNTDEVRAARRTALELLLSDHVGDCVAPCTLACPAHLDICTMNRMIAAGRMAEAVAVVKDRIPLPGVLGRICARPCERVCHRRAGGAAIAICALKRYVAESDRRAESRYLPARRPATGKRVAIVGAGPAGLSAAWFLQQWGHDCTLFDANAQAGGALRTSVPEEILPRAALDADIAAIAALGVEMRQGVRADPDRLPQTFDATLLATGAPPNDAAPELPAVDRRTFATSRPGWFAAGDLVLRARAAVRAVASGRTAAVSIHQFLGGRPVHEELSEIHVRMGRLSETEQKAFQIPCNTARPPGDDLSDAEAAAEARRCLQCDCLARDTCRLRQLSTEYDAAPARFRGERRLFTRDASHPDVIYESGKCVACGLCVRLAEQEGVRPGVSFTGRGFSGRVSVPFGGSVAEGLGRAALRCAAVCPTGALRARRV